MKAGAWRKRIIAACEEAKTYKPFFDDVIDTLAKIMERRDDCLKKYKASGGEPFVIHVNKAGHENMAKNPALVLLMEHDAQALAYWRDLGLTPAGYKKLNAVVVEDNSDGALEAILSKLG